MEEQTFWYWKDFEVSFDLLGDEITKGTGMWEKKYQYIKIPIGYGYDNYCFLLSTKLVKYNPLKNKWSFSICFDMNIELFYDPEYREPGKKYKRYKMTGMQLFEEIFKMYEVNYAQECEQRLAKQQEERARRERKILGDIIYGRYMGNNYGDDPDIARNYFFKSNGTYLCINDNGTEIHQKVNNVETSYIVMENVSKHFYRETKSIINHRLKNWILINDKATELDKTHQVLSEIGIECNQDFANITLKLQHTADAILSTLIKDIEHWR